MVWCFPSYLLASLRPGAGHRSNGKASSLNEPPHPKVAGAFFFSNLMEPRTLQQAQTSEEKRHTSRSPTGAPSKRTGAQLLWEALLREGVDIVFWYPGGAIMPAYDALPGYAIRHVLVRHEQGASHMADGYARSSGRVGVAIATSGPGATNMVTGIATAMMDSSPVVCITGQVGSKLIGSDAFQETDITGITLPITKHNYLVTHASEIAPAIREAFAVAASGRPGPVLVDITKDAQQTSCEFDWDAAAPDLDALARPGHSAGM